ncbi:MAG: formyltransferase family protein [Vampirovibrionales bacterium]
MDTSYTLAHGLDTSKPYVSSQDLPRCLVLVGEGLLFEALLAHPSLLQQLNHQGIHCKLLCPRPSKPWLHAIQATGFPVYTHITALNTETFYAWVQSHTPQHHVMITGGWGEKLNEQTLQTPHTTWYNLHPSMLPRYRGATPCRAQVWFQDPYGGITLHETHQVIDAGSIVAQYPVYLSDLEGHTAGSLLTYYTRHAGARAWLRQWLYTLVHPTQGDTFTRTPQGRIPHHEAPWATRRLLLKDCLLTEVIHTLPSRVHPKEVCSQALERYQRSLAPFAHLLIPLTLPFGLTLGYIALPYQESTRMSATGIHLHVALQKTHQATLSTGVWLTLRTVYYQYGTAQYPLPYLMAYWILKIVFSFKLAQNSLSLTLKLM